MIFTLGRAADHVNIEFFDLAGQLARRLVFHAATNYTGRDARSRCVGREGRGRPHGSLRALRHARRGEVQDVAHLRARQRRGRGGEVGVPMRTLTVPLVALIVAVALATAASANFVEVDTGARAMGMGGAFVAVADDVTALHWNPAGLAELDRIQVFGMRTSVYGVDAISEDSAIAGWGTGPARVRARLGAHRREGPVSTRTRSCWARGPRRPSRGSGGHRREAPFGGRARVRLLQRPELQHGRRRRRSRRTSAASTGARPGAPRPS